MGASRVGSPSTRARVSGVVAVHDLHVWTITSGLVALSCHVCAHDHATASELLARLQELLNSRFGIDHVTIQIEPLDFEERRHPV